MKTALMRRELRSLYEAGQDAHPGLLLQRGLPEHETEDFEAKRKHIERVICQNRIGDLYRHAYQRWEKTTTDAMRFRSVKLKLENRMFIGLTGGGMMETGCAIGHSHGVPYIPGSSVKGIVNTWGRERIDSTEDESSICAELFGAPADGDMPEGLSAAITFHDAWWVPGSAESPLMPEIVTTHHPDYYGKDGSEPATDFDSPVPNAQIAVRGSFRFTVEGPPVWLELMERMLKMALTDLGAGAKTRAGYGLFIAETDTPQTGPLQKGDAVEATLYKDDRGRWRGRTGDGQQGVVFTPFGVPDDAEPGGTKTLYVRVAKPLQFQWEKPARGKRVGRTAST